MLPRAFVDDLYDDPDCEDLELDYAMFEAVVWPTIAERIPNARYLKLEDPPLMEKIGSIRARTAAGRPGASPIIPSCPITSSAGCRRDR